MQMQLNLYVIMFYSFVSHNGDAELSSRLWMFLKPTAASGTVVVEQAVVGLN